MPTADEANRLPLAIEFFTRANEFLQAFRDLPSQAPPDWPRYLMLSHATELALKAYLLLRGMPEDELWQKFGHDLEKLQRRSTELGLPIESLAADIEALNEAHMNNWLRYPKSESYNRVATVDQFETCVQQVFNAVHSAIYEKKRSRA